VAFADVSRLGHPGFFAHMDPPTPWHAHDTAAVQGRLGGAWVSTVDIGGQQWFRPVAANPCADAATVVRAVRDAMSSLR
jgi:hypothetical protein